MSAVEVGDAVQEDVVVATHTGNGKVAKFIHYQLISSL